MEQELKKKRRLPLPNNPTLLILMIVVAALMTYIVPAGEFDRVVDEVTGRTLVVANTYHAIEGHATTFMELMQSIYNGMVSASEIGWFIFVTGGAFGILGRTGAVTAGLNKLVGKYRGKEAVLLTVITIAFAVGGASFGMCEETLPFIVILLPIVVKMGYDPLVAAAITMGATYCGYSAGVLNPFNTGVAQGICELPTFSGMGLRIVLGIGCTIILAWHTLSYAKKNKVTANSEELRKIAAENSGLEERDFNNTDKAILGVLVLTICTLVVCVLKFGWYLQEISGLFMLMAIVMGLIYFKGSLNQCVNEFLLGCKDMAVPVMLVCFSKSILVLLESGGIMDTVVYALSIPLSHISSVFAAWGMYLAMGLVNFLIPSSSGQAAVVMPIMAPLADLVGITRQTAVLAFQCGDGYWNLICPTNAVTMAGIGLAGVSFSKWFKYALPLVIKQSIWIFIVLAIAVVTNYGPF